MNKQEFIISTAKEIFMKLVEHGKVVVQDKMNGQISPQLMDESFKAITDAVKKQYDAIK